MDSMPKWGPLHLSPAGMALKIASERLGKSHRVTMSFPWV